MIQVKFKAKTVNLWWKSYLNAIKTRKTQNQFAFTLSNLVKYVMFDENDSILNATFFGIYKDNRHIYCQRGSTLNKVFQ